MREEDFSVEDDVETAETMSSMATNEFSRLVERLKYEARKEKILYLRSMGRLERQKLKNVDQRP